MFTCLQIGHMEVEYSWKGNENDWDRMESDFMNSTAMLHWLQGEAHDEFSDAVIAVDAAKEAIRRARAAYFNNNKSD